MTTTNQIVPATQLAQPNINGVQQLLEKAVASYQAGRLSDLELAREIQRLRAAGVKVEEIANAFGGYSRSWVHYRLAILDLEPEVLALMSPKLPENQRLSWANAITLTRAVGQAKLQLDLAREICQQRLNKWQTRRFVREKVKQARASQPASVAQLARPIMDETQQLLDNTVAGYKAKSLSVVELARNLKKIRAMGMRPRKIAKAFGFGIAWFWQRLDLLALEPEVLALMSKKAKDGGLTFSNALVLTDIVGHGELQLELAREICRQRLGFRQACLLVKKRANQAGILLASDTGSLEQEFRELVRFADIANDKFAAASRVKRFRFKAMLNAYEVEDVKKLRELLNGCAKHCARMAKKCQTHLQKEGQ